MDTDFQIKREEYLKKREDHIKEVLEKHPCGKEKAVYTNVSLYYSPVIIATIKHCNELAGKKVFELVVDPKNNKNVLVLVTDNSVNIRLSYLRTLFDSSKTLINNLYSQEVVNSYKDYNEENIRNFVSSQIKILEVMESQRENLKENTFSLTMIDKTTKLIEYGKRILAAIKEIEDTEEVEEIGE